MPNPNITFDHVHLISKDPQATARWYVDKLGADIVRDVTVKGAPQVYVEIGGGAMLVVVMDTGSFGFLNSARKSLIKSTRFFS